MRLFRNATPRSVDQGIRKPTNRRGLRRWTSDDEWHSFVKSSRLEPDPPKTQGWHVL